MTPARRRRVRILGLLAAIGGLAAAGFVFATRADAIPDVPMADVTRGDFVDYVQLRGNIRPAKSIVLSAPADAGDLQILRLAKNGGAVKAGDILVQFDATTLRQRTQEKQSELKQADAEITQMQAQLRITEEQDQAAVMKARYDLDRAKLDLGKRDLVSRLEYEQAKLAVADAEQRLREAEQKATSNKTGAEADIVAKERKQDKARSISSVRSTGSTRCRSNRPPPASST